MNSRLPIWQRLPVTVGMMLLASYLAGLLCQGVFNIPIPSYAAGAIGGLAAIPTWDFLKRIKPSQQK